MTTCHRWLVLGAALPAALALAQPSPPAAASFAGGYPTPTATPRLYDEMDYQRAVQAYL